MRKKIDVILQHGWAFDSSCWRGWLPHLKENPGCEVRIQTADRGYFGEAKEVEPFKNDADSCKIVVAHSLGLHLVPEEILKKTDLLVLAGAFSYFHNGDAMEQKRSRRTVNIMLEKLNIDALAVLDDFYSNCYKPLLTSQMLLMRKTDNINVDLLTEDLELLNTNHFDLSKIRQIPNILILQGSEDCIVTPAQSQTLHQELKGSSIVLFEGAGHSLPLTHVAPAWISVRAAMRQISPVRA